MLESFALHLVGGAKYAVRVVDAIVAIIVAIDYDHFAFGGHDLGAWWKLVRLPDALDRVGVFFVVSMSSEEEVTVTTLLG